MQRTKSRMRRRAAAAIVAMGLGLAPVLAVATPAAATTCTSVGWDGYGSGVASANCSGGGQMRFKATCNGVAPWPGWVKYSAWLTVPPSGATMAALFPTCSIWSGYSIDVQYG